MGDDLVTDGILPVGGTVIDGEFDPNAVESDDFLPDDPVEVITPEEVVDAPVAVVVEEDDDDDILDE
ncbi:MAG: hypothetical protein Q7S52_01535 [bacterium]|nr:hypothetical protein [bacterium]